MDVREGENDAPNSVPIEHTSKQTRPLTSAGKDH